MATFLSDNKKMPHYHALSKFSYLFHTLPTPLSSLRERARVRVNDNSVISTTTVVPAKAGIQGWRGGPPSYEFVPTQNSETK